MVPDRDAFFGLDGRAQPIAVSGCTGRWGIAERQIDRMRCNEWIVCGSQVRVDAGPTVLLRRRHHGGTNGIEFDVADDVEQMAPVVDHARFEATLPERTAATVTSVEMLDVTLPGIAHGCRHQQVHVVAHQHESVHLHRMPLTGVAEQAPIMAAVLIIDEGRAPIDAALGDMKRDAGQEKTGLSWHGARGEAAG